MTGPQSLRLRTAFAGNDDVVAMTPLTHTGVAPRRGVSWLGSASLAVGHRFASHARCCIEGGQQAER